MSFVDYGSLGSSNLKVAGTTITLAVPRTVEVGHFILLWGAWERDYSSGVGPEGEVVYSAAAYDTAGNHWCSLLNWMHEVNVMVFGVQVTTALGVGDIITVQHRSNIYEAKAISAWEFGTTNPLSIWARNERMALNSRRTADPLPISTNPATVRGGLHVHALACYGPDTDTYTGWTAAGFTEIDGDGTTGGADADNITIRGGWKIDDSASVSIDVTNSSGVRKNDQALLTLIEVPYISAFPIEPIIDDFNRADETPMDGGIWLDGADTDCWPETGARNMAVIGNEAAIGPGSGSGSQFTESETWECYREAYATLATVGNAHVGFDATGCGNHSFLGARGVRYWPYGGGGGPGSSVAPHLTLGHFGSAGQEVGHDPKSWVTLVDGNKMGIQRDSRDLSVLHAWADLGDGWEWLCAMVQNVFTEVSGAYMLSVWGDSVTRLDDFGGGGDDCPTYWVALNHRSATRHKSATRALIHTGET